MVPLKSWIEKLILRCAKKDEVNKFIKEQQIEKKLNVVNSDVATNSVPTPNTTGVLGSVDFKDSRDALIAALEAYRTPMEGKGIRLRINDNYLGFRVSDEGISTSYVNHPNPDGPANQIATMKYVADWGNALQSALNGLDNLSQNTLDTLNNTLFNTLEYPVSDSNALVTSKGIYTYGQNIISTLMHNVNTAIDGITFANTTYSFALNGNNLIITPNSGNTQTIDLSTIVPSINSNNSLGSVETESIYAGYRIWRNGNLAAVFVPGGNSINSGEAISKTLPFAMQAIIISTHTVGSFIGSSSVSGTCQDNSNYTIRLIKNGIKVEVSYTSGNNSSNPSEDNSSSEDPNIDPNIDPNTNTDTNENSNEDNSTNTDPNTNEDPNTDTNEDPSEDTSPSTGIFPDITIIGWVL
jgi:hypothetical protein